MMDKQLEDDPDLLADTGLTYEEMHAHMVEKMCQPYNQLHAKAYRKRYAEKMEEHYLKDTIRKAYNGGNKFHPYM